MQVGVPLILCNCTTTEMFWWFHYQPQYYCVTPDPAIYYGLAVDYVTTDPEDTAV